MGLDSEVQRETHFLPVLSHQGLTCPKSRFLLEGTANLPSTGAMLPRRTASSILQTKCWSFSASLHSFQAWLLSVFHFPPPRTGLLQFGFWRTAISLLPVRCLHFSHEFRRLVPSRLLLPHAVKCEKKTKCGKNSSNAAGRNNSGGVSRAGVTH